MTNVPRFGIWANVHGTFGSLQHPDDPVDASWRRVRDQIVLADRLGYDSTLIAQHTMNPLGEDLEQLDAWSAAAAAAALTERIEIIAAIKPSIIHPTVIAKSILGIEDISEGRFSINVVNAWWKPDLERSGIGMLPHDQRYAYGTEWLHVVRRLIAGESVTFEGTYFQLDRFGLAPASRHRDRPLIYLGGESDQARALAAQETDVLFLNGQERDRATEIISDVTGRPRVGLEPIRFGIVAFPVVAATDELAQECLEQHWELNARDKADAGDTNERYGKDVDPGSTMWKQLRAKPHIGPNGGTATGLTGSYDTVAQRIVEWNALGIETFMLAFQPFETEMEIFAQKVMPRVRALLKTS